MENKKIKLLAATLIVVTIISILIGLANIYKVADGRDEDGTLLFTGYAKSHGSLRESTIAGYYLAVALVTLALQGITIQMMLKGKTKLVLPIFSSNFVILFSIISCIGYDLQIASRTAIAVHSYIIPGMCNAALLMLCIFYYQNNKASIRIFVGVLAAIMWYALYLMYDSYQFHL